MKVMRMKRSLIVGSTILVIVIVAVLLFVQSFKATPTETQQDDPMVVRIGYPVLRIGLPVFVAKEQGFFEQRGLDVEMVRFETAQPMMDALVGGSLDIGGFCALPITFSAMARSKTSLLFIGSMMEDDQHPISLLLTTPDSGITTIDGLTGKRVGILPTRAYEVWLKTILSTNGVDPNSVIIQQIPPPQQALALQSGAVDALFTNDPAATAAQVKANAIPVIPGQSPVPRTTGLDPFYFGSFNVKRSFAQANPEVVHRLSLALDDAIQFIRDNPDEANEAMRAYLPAEQRELISRFPNSNFLKSYETTQGDLNEILSYYTDQNILSAELDLRNAQYQRAE